jgi:8-oxo-dGTP pyrophosphatase MutT (NUDIX family)
LTLSIRVRRVAYRCAFNALQAWWWVRRPTLRGAKCVLTDGPAVLLVRHTYGQRHWDLPGGKVERGEEPIVAGRREAIEELGLEIDSWQPLGQIEIVADHRDDTLFAFHAEVSSPELTLALAELQEARWFDRADLPPVMAKHARQIVAMLP